MYDLNQENLKCQYNYYLNGIDFYNREKENYENNYTINSKNLSFEGLYNYIFLNNDDFSSIYCFDSDSGMGKSYTIQRLLSRSIWEFKVLYINFSDEDTIDFDKYNSSNISNKIFKIFNNEYSFNDLINYGNGENVYIFFDNVKLLSVNEMDKLINIIKFLKNNNIIAVMDFKIDIEDVKLIEIKSINIIDSSDKVLDNILNINILYIIYDKLSRHMFSDNLNKDIFKEYKGNGQLLWNYYQIIVKQRATSRSEEYKYVCDYIVPYIGYMKCFHCTLNKDGILETSTDRFENIYEDIKEYYPCKFKSEQLLDELKKVPIIRITNNKITFIHEYYANFVSAIHLLNNDLIYLKTGENPLLKRNQRTTDDNDIVTDFYVDLYNLGDEENDKNNFLIEKLRYIAEDCNDEVKGRFRNIINDIIFYPIYNRNANLENSTKATRTFLENDSEKSYGKDDFGQWSKAFCLEKLAMLHYEKDGKNSKNAEAYLSTAHETLIGILNKNNNCNKEYKKICEANIKDIIDNYNSKLIKEKRVYHVLGKIYANYEEITGVANGHKFYEKAADDSRFSCNLLGGYYERKKEYSLAEKYYMKSIEMGDIWANKAIVNLYLKADFNKYYKIYKSIKERYALVERYLKNMAYSNVSHIFITVYKANILKKIIAYSNEIKTNSEFDEYFENRYGDNIVKNENIFDKFIIVLFNEIEKITDFIYDKNNKIEDKDKENEFIKRIYKFYENLDLLKMRLNEDDLKISQKVAGMCFAIGTRENYNICSIGKQDDLNTSSRLIDSNSIFDLASVTKLFTAIVVNVLCNDNNYNINLNSKIKELDSRYNNLGNTTVEDLLTFRVNVYSDRLTNEDYNLDKIYNCKINEKPENFYTDMGAIILELIINKVTNKNLDYWVKKIILDKIDKNNSIFANVIDKDLVVSNDCEYRQNNILHRTDLGQVHDEKARILNNIVTNGEQICHGHAGLFASIEDLSKLFILLLNGEIVDVAILEKISINHVGKYEEDKTSKYLGELCYSKNPIAKNSEIPVYFSCKTIGCGGYTGNHICIDTKNEVFTILLSNRCNNRITYDNGDINKIDNTFNFVYDRENLVKKLSLLALEKKFIELLKNEIKMIK